MLGGFALKKSIPPADLGIFRKVTCEAVRAEPLLPGWRWCVSPWHSSSSLEQLSLYSCLLEGQVHPLHKGVDTSSASRMCWSEHAHVLGMGGSAKLGLCCCSCSIHGAGWPNPPRKLPMHPTNQPKHHSLCWAFAGCWEP